MGASLGLEPCGYLSDFLTHKYDLPDCLVDAGPNLKVLCSDERTHDMDVLVSAMVAREFALEKSMKPCEPDFDAVVLDVAPSITLLQTCAMVHSRNVLIPVDMDLLSLSGAGAAYEMVKLLSDALQVDIRVVGVVPTQLDNRLKVTDNVIAGIEKMAKEYKIPLLPQVRTDQSIDKAYKQRQAVIVYDPEAKASEDYRAVFDQMLKLVVDAQAA